MTSNACMNVYDLSEEDFEVFVRDNPEWVVKQLRSMHADNAEMRIARVSVADVAAEMAGVVQGCGIIPEDSAFDNARVVTNRQILDWVNELKGDSPK